MVFGGGGGGVVVGGGVLGSEALQGRWAEEGGETPAIREGKRAAKKCGRHCQATMERAMVEER